MTTAHGVSPFFTDMPFHNKQRDIDPQHEDAIKSGLSHRPHMDEYRGWVIDNITLIGEEADGDRIYRVQDSAWDEFEDKCPLIWEVQTGQVDGCIEALYWLAM